MAFVIGLPILLLLIQLHTLATSTVHGSNLTAHFQCHPEEAATLLQLKQSFYFDFATTTLPSWEAGTDCCLWEGVGCHAASGRVTALELSGRGLFSYRLDQAVFNLTSLQRLDLSRNDFGGSVLPAAGFERLSSLTHLNLSYSGFYGQIPIAVGKLTNLVSLDLSCHENLVDDDDDDDDAEFLLTLLKGYNVLLLQEPNFQTFMENLGNLRELYLDGVYISSSGEEWCNALATYVPGLQVLSMEDCGLHGPIHPSLANLRSLVVLKLQENDMSGTIPESFVDYLNISVLRLGSNNLDGWFPRRILQLKNLKVLDVSQNPDLSGCLPKFAEGSSLETLNVQSTNFSCCKPNTFRNFMSLKELSLDGKFIYMKPRCSFSTLKTLHKLQISLFGLSRDIETSFTWIGHLRNLTTLELSYYNFSTIVPTWIGKLKNLRTLEISDCSFSGPIPSEVTNLKKLVSLKISGCSFSGPIPPSFGNLRNLRILAISNCRLFGSIPPAIGNLKKLTILQLENCGVSGIVPRSFANLTRLVSLDLANNHLSGVVPTYLFTLPPLQVLILSSNQLSGPIQEFDPSSSSLAFVNLSTNLLTGKVSRSFFQLASLVALDLDSNYLTGLVDLSTLWRLRKLAVLSLSNNRLSVVDGKIHNSTIPLLPKLTILDLASCNITEFPSFLMYLDFIGDLDLSCNRIQGTIPKRIWKTWSSRPISLNLSHNMLSSLEPSSHDLPNSQIYSIDLSFNRFDGPSILPNLTPYLTQTAFLKMSNNNITGEIPYSICNSSELEVLDLSHNNLSGSVPSCLIEDGRLTILTLRENHLEGALAYNVKNECAFQTVDLNGNNIEGQLPRTFANCISLEVLDLGNNQIVDTFPSWLGSLSNLRVLVLRSNQFYGSIGYLKYDKSGERFSSLQIIDLASNNFSGSLHPQWFEMFKPMDRCNNTGQIIGHKNLSSGFYQDTVTISYKGSPMTFERIFTTLTAIDLSGNALDGSIPESVGRLVSLHALNMSHNAFSGKIPPQIGGMTALESLDLSSNQLSGEIPQELTNLTFLAILNLSNNRLEGRIPQARQFGTFENGSYEGNSGLCGLPLSKQCGSSNAPSEAHGNSSSEHADIVLFLFVGGGFGVGFAAAVLMKPSWVGRWFRSVSILMKAQV